jgi:hypothetical protein
MDMRGPERSAGERRPARGDVADDLISTLFSATLALGSAHGLIHEQPDRAVTRLEGVVDVLDDLMGALRHGQHHRPDPEELSASDRWPDAAPEAVIGLTCTVGDRSSITIHIPELLSTATGEADAVVALSASIQLPFQVVVTLTELVMDRLADALSESEGEPVSGWRSGWPLSAEALGPSGPKPAMVPAGPG